MLRRLFIAVTLTSIALLASRATRAGAASLVATSRPYAGVTHLVYEESAIPARIHVVVVDLTSSEISLHATSEGQRGKKVSAFSALSGAQVVINGDFFTGGDFRPTGLAMGMATLWAGSSDDASSGFIRFDRNGERNNVDISRPVEKVEASSLAPGTQGVVGGHPMLVRAGIAESSFDCGDAVAMPCARAPRSAVGIAADGNSMVLVVVDGWQAGSLGMTAGELGIFLAALPISDALMLDGGGATSMYIAAEGGIVNSPSDGVERAVANHLGVRFGSLPSGQLVGFVRARDIFDDTANLSGALVTLDDGRQATTGSDGRYSFSAVTARLACATATLSGYQPGSACKQIIPNQVSYNSIALFPNSEIVDAGAGVPDAAVGSADANPARPDAGAAKRDAGAPNDAKGGGGGGGCNSASGPTNPRAIALAMLLLLLGRARRRTRARPTQNAKESDHNKLAIALSGPSASLRCLPVACPSRLHSSRRLWRASRQRSWPVYYAKSRRPPTH